MGGDPDFPDDSKEASTDSGNDANDNSSGMPDDIAGEDGDIFGTMSEAYDSWSEGGEDGDSNGSSAQDAPAQEAKLNDSGSHVGEEAATAENNDSDADHDDGDTETDDLPPLDWTDDMDEEWKGEEGDFEADPEVDLEDSDGAMPDPSYYHDVEDTSDADTRDLPDQLPEKLDGDR